MRKMRRAYKVLLMMKRVPPATLHKCLLAKQVDSLLRNNLGRHSISVTCSHIMLPEIRECAFCSKSHQLQYCDRCNAVGYCSLACSQAHWPEHRDNCLPELLGSESCHGCRTTPAIRLPQNCVACGGQLCEACATLYGNDMVHRKCLNFQ